MSNADATTKPHQPAWLMIWGLSFGLAIWFWLDLWLGGGLIGGDVYSYYFPQKAFYAESLQTGSAVGWNSLTGHGYPTLGESQTGVFYPLNQLLYRYQDLNTAYNINHLLHYILAFVAMVLLGRELSLSFTGSALAGLVFVYGWFAPRCCFEWAILTGTYLPWLLWLLLSYRRTLHPVWLWGLSVSLCLQLLIGHYNLAFITLLALAGWILLTAICRRLFASTSTTEPASATNFRYRAWSLPLLALGLGLLMSSMQLLPTWELKQESQRQTATSSADFSPGYGHLPPRYVSQMFLPWVWYAEPQKLDALLNQKDSLSIAAGTNPIEAHLYLGLIPLILAIFGGCCLLQKKYRNQQTESSLHLIVFGIMGLLGLIYAFGWLIPVTQHLPGFSYFRGPGRFTILTSLAGSLLAAYGWDILKNWLHSNWRGPVWSCLFLLTLFDLSLVSQRITYTFMMPSTPINLREESEIRKMLAGQLPPARLFAPGPNLPTLTGVAAYPVYLGIGPAAYFNPDLMFPEHQHPHKAFGESFTPEQIDWLQKAGITHVLGFAPPDPEISQLRLIWSGHDEFLNKAWMRAEPLYLSELLGSRERAAWLPLPVESQPPTRRLVDPTLTWREYQPGYQSVAVATPQARTLLFTDLLDKNWQLTINGEPQTPLKLEGMFRGVNVPAGNHLVEWRYQYGALKQYFLLSFAGFTIWLVWGVVIFVRRKSDAT